jgi:oligoendopeptidase F
MTFFYQSPAAVTTAYEALLSQKVQSMLEFRGWMKAWDELEAKFAEDGSRRYARMTCNTADQAAEASYLEYVANYRPLWQECSDRAKRQYVQYREQLGCPGPEYEIFGRDLQAEIDLFRTENLPLQAEEAKLAQQYQKLCGELSIQLEGKELPLTQVAPIFMSAARETREQLWRQAWSARAAIVSQIDGIFDSLCGLRTKIAAQAGCASYIEYAFRSMKRFDYTPADCQRFHASIEKYCVPLTRRLYQQRAKALSLEQLRPWDLSLTRFFENLVALPGKPKEKPFQDVPQLITLVQSMLQRINPGFAQGIAEMQSRGELDLGSAKARAPGAYCSSFDQLRRPFIFMSAAGTNEDVMTLLHEFGHAQHVIETAQHDFLPYRSSVPIEFCEVASMSMEQFGLCHAPEVLGTAAGAALRQSQYSHVLLFLPYMAQVDAFQHWLYQGPTRSATERRAKWTELCERFGAPVDWSALESYRGHFWHQQSHLFCSPFYYVEYGIAQLGALQLWQRYRTDPTATIRDYQRALALGGSRGLPDLFAAAGIRFDFSEATIAPLVGLVAEELGL